MIATNFAVIVPMANESRNFASFVHALGAVLDRLGSGHAYFVVDHASRDDTLALCQALAARDGRFIAVWAPENRHVVDAYMAGYRAALAGGHDVIIEMDAGLSHDPRAIPMFLRVLNEGNECAFGSRFINGGSIYQSTWRRTMLSKAGTWLSNLLLGTSYHDATSGFQAFHADMVRKFTACGLQSKAHFYQTELRYLLRQTRHAEVPIHYRAPSPSVSRKAILNSLAVLLRYVLLRLRGRAPLII